jgi:hydroxymethylpyrimidine pyrophosphatase-like HAD family hydrolase
MKKKRICFDIDNVICSTNKKKDYAKSKPIIKNIQAVNKIYKEGYIVVLYTARYMS